MTVSGDACSSLCINAGDINRTADTVEPSRVDSCKQSPPFNPARASVQVQQAAFLSRQAGSALRVSAAAPLRLFARVQKRSALKDLRNGAIVVNLNGFRASRTDGCLQSQIRRSVVQSRLLSRSNRSLRFSHCRLRCFFVHLLASTHVEKDVDFVDVFNRPSLHFHLLSHCFLEQETEPRRF